MKSRIHEDISAQVKNVIHQRVWVDCPAMHWIELHASTEGYITPRVSNIHSAIKGEVWEHLKRTARWLTPEV